MPGFTLNSYMPGQRALFAVLAYTSACISGLSAPGNDNFTNRTVVTGSSITINGTLAGASLEAIENGPPFNSSSGGSVWYSWTAPQSTRVVIELLRDYTSLSSSNTTFEIYTGTALNTLTFVDGNNFEWPSGRYAAFAAAAGTAYQFRVAGGWGGPFSLKLTATNPPVFLKQPVDCAVSPFASALFTALAAGPRPGTYYKNPVTYQWLSNGIPIAGETGASLLVHRASIDQIAQYSVIASNTGGTTTSAAATFSIIETNASPQLMILRPSTPDKMSLTLNGQFGRWYLVESTDDLNNWPLKNLSPRTNMFSLQITNHPISLLLPRLSPIHYVRASLNLRTETCVGQLRQMYWAQQVAAIDNNLSLQQSLSFDQLKPYVPLDPSGWPHVCPEGGTYMMGGSFTNVVTCTIGSYGHVIDAP